MAYNFRLAFPTHLDVLNLLTDIILSSEEIASIEEERVEGPLCFYEVLADHFVWVPKNGEPILDLIVKLWSQAFASHIFSLLFHKWVRLAVYPFPYCQIIFIWQYNIVSIS